MPTFQLTEIQLVSGLMLLIRLQEQKARNEDSDKYEDDEPSDRNPHPYC
jgi:hypothetical protein